MFLLSGCKGVYETLYVPLQSDYFGDTLRVPMCGSVNSGCIWPCVTVSESSAQEVKTNSQGVAAKAVSAVSVLHVYILNNKLFFSSKILN